MRSLLIFSIFLACGCDAHLDSDYAKYLVGGLEGAERDIVDISFAATGTRLAASIDWDKNQTDGSVLLWDVDQRSQLRQLMGNIDGLPKVEFSPDGSQIMVASRLPARILVFDAEVLDSFALLDDGENMFEVMATHWLPQQPAQVLAVVHHLTTYEDCLSFWDAQTDGQHMSIYDDSANACIGPNLDYSKYGRHDLMVSTVSADGKYLASGGPTDELEVNLIVSQIIFEPSRQLNEVMALALDYEVFRLAFSPDSKLLAVGGDDRKVGIWDLADLAGEPVMEIDSLLDEVHGLDFSPDGSLLAVGGHSRQWDHGKTRLFRVSDGQQIWEVPDGNNVAAVAFSPLSQKILATGGSDRNIKLWDVSAFW